MLNIWFSYLFCIFEPNIFVGWLALGCDVISVSNANRTRIGSREHPDVLFFFNPNKSGSHKHRFFVFFRSDVFNPNRIGNRKYPNFFFPAVIGYVLVSPPPPHPLFAAVRPREENSINRKQRGKTPKANTLYVLSTSASLFYSLFL